MDNIDISFNAGRLCEAIARIGYEPDSAIMDIVDNSVSARASNVYITLFLREGKTIKSRNAVEKYQIVDDGRGMDEKGIQDAFALGSKRDYESNSLSKYGLGLKSAGLSLGTKISIISKQKNKLTNKFIFDKEIIEKENKFVIKKVTLNDGELNYYKTLLSEENGTVIEVEGSEKINHASPDATRNKLKKRLGVVYYSFLKNNEFDLNLFVKIQPHSEICEFEKIGPKDILHTDNALFKKHWSPDNYDYVSPYLALDESWVLHDVDGVKLPEINVQAVVFPQSAMGKIHSPLDKEQKKIVNSYEITKENSGFFIYRNGRLIRWGDELDGLITKDDFNIRIRLDLKSEHDDVLHVDVTKQRLEIDDEHKSKLEQIISKSKRTAKDIRELCLKLIKEAKVGDEGVAFSETLQGVTEDDPDEITGALPSNEVVERKKQSSQASKAVIEEINKEREQIEISEIDEDSQNDRELENNALNNDSSFRKINYSTKVEYGYVWKPYHDAIEGTFVNVSKIHPYYSQFLSRYPENSIARISLEALIFSVANAENNVKHNYENVDIKTLEEIFRKFHKNISTWLAEWSSENYDMSDE
ncbi:ATP-binding protein [Klebsiella pneumoniae]|uniref:ATP-binding protein n=1 Tax=Klebsiella pneumoniae TaxID=573 RepID=UPI001005A6A5|nr:ATP-binding protein [Klebsiella pneumoniae]MDX7193276.1 ATP-binding protein [Klebsiella pneumoniae]VAX92650.1 Uncharacterised protein [Klebsiella pneumoniae]